MRDLRTSADLPYVEHNGTRWFYPSLGQEFKVTAIAKYTHLKSKETLDLEFEAVVDGRETSYIQTAYSSKTEARRKELGLHQDVVDGGEESFDHSGWDEENQHYVIDFIGWMVSDASCKPFVVQKSSGARGSSCAAAASSADNPSTAGTIEIKVWKVKWKGIGGPRFPHPPIDAPPGVTQPDGDKKWFKQPGQVTAAGARSIAATNIVYEDADQLKVLERIVVKYDEEISLRLRGILPALDVKPEVLARRGKREFKRGPVSQVVWSCDLTNSDDEEVTIWTAKKIRTESDEVSCQIRERTDEQLQGR